MPQTQQRTALLLERANGEWMIGGGMVFDRKMKDVAALCQAIRNAEAIELLDGAKALPEQED